MRFRARLIAYVALGSALVLQLRVVAPAEEKTPKPVIFAIAPGGNDDSAGTVEAPFRTLRRAQQAVLSANADHDVEVQLADGVYRVDHTLVFRDVDGGRNGHHVTWTAAPGAHPVLSGAVQVKGWKLWDKGRNIYVADTAVGMKSRELWVNDKLAPMASVEVPRKDVTFTLQGINFQGHSAELLKGLQHADGLEVRATGFFTNRISPVNHVSGDSLVMTQPAWGNNLWGYDTIEKPFHPELAHLYLANAIELLREPGQWYLDAPKGKLYVIPPVGVDPEQMDVELPRLAVLVSIGNSLERPVQDLTFSGIQFSYTSWLGPASPEGYASQQSGSYLAGRAAAFPADPIHTCAQGCTAFESMRSEWMQMPASVQVSASQRVTFEHDTFAHLGQYALGIGNDADANWSGVGLGTSDVTVVANVFTDDAGGAILAGGIQREAHHPEDPREVNRQLIIRSNRISSVSKEYLDNSAVLSTYVDGAIILHNDISDVPYDAIDIGYGWGINDPGGNPNYRARMHGYEWSQNRVYQTATTHRDVVVANNRIHSAKKLFHDGGAIYNLSASPGTLITENYIFDNNGQIAFYLDEGSRYITIRKNVVDDPEGEWLNINTVHAAYPLRISPDNTAADNWHNGTKVGGMWTNYENDLILDDHLVTDDRWPADAQAVMKNAGIEPGLEPAAPNSSTGAVYGAGNRRKTTVPAQ